MQPKHDLETLRNARNAARDARDAAQAAYLATPEYKTWVKANDNYLASVASVVRAVHDLPK